MITSNNVTGTVFSLHARLILQQINYIQMDKWLNFENKNQNRLTKNIWKKLRF